MGQQSYTNHRRFVPGFHFFTSLLAVIIFGLAAYKLVQSMISGQWLFSDIVYTGLLPVLIAVVLLLLFWYSRQFATKVQDRAIRAEENLRHFILTGKPFDHRLTMGQIVALRFAHDEEFVELCKKAADENLGPDAIKKAITNWRADHHRA